MLNWDQTAVRMSTKRRGHAHKGVKTVSRPGSDDKRQITALPAGSACGQFLKPRPILAGTEDLEGDLPVNRGRPAFKGFHFCQTPSHWSTMGSMNQYVCQIITPFLEEQRLKLGLPEGQAFNVLIGPMVAAAPERGAAPAATTRVGGHGRRGRPPIRSLGGRTGGGMQGITS